MCNVVYLLFNEFPNESVKTICLNEMFLTIFKFVLIGVLL